MVIIYFLVALIALLILLRAVEVFNARQNEIAVQRFSFTGKHNAYIRISILILFLILILITHYSVDIIRFLQKHTFLYASPQ